MTAIYKRELKSYFDTMIGFVFIAFIVAAMGIYFFVYNMSGGYPYFSATLTGTLFVLLISIPVLTMKCLADEKRSKTDQLLLTAPISLTKIILGKYFAMVTIFAIPVLISCLCPLIIKANGTAYLFNDYASILAFFLMGCVYIAIGMFISSLTESQIIAAVGTFGILFLLQLWPDLIAYLPSTAAASFIGFIVIVLLIALIINSMTKKWL
ncbi:MAG: ABC transporter permease, partial [Lachnospiraceae bacterium]